MLAVALLANALTIAAYCIGRRVAARLSRWHAGWSYRRYLKKNPPSEAQNSTVATIGEIYKQIYTPWFEFASVKKDVAETDGEP